RGVLRAAGWGPARRRLGGRTHEHLPARRAARRAALRHPRVDVVGGEFGGIPGGVCVCELRGGGRVTDASPGASTHRTRPRTAGGISSRGATSRAASHRAMLLATRAPHTPCPISSITAPTTCCFAKDTRG